MLSDDTPTDPPPGPPAAQDDPLRTAIRRFMAGRPALNAYAWCRAAGIHESVLRGFLDGRSQSLTFRTLQRLAQAAGVKVSQLTGDEPDLIDRGAFVAIGVTVLVEALAYRSQVTVDANEENLTYLPIPADLATFPVFGATVCDPSVDEIYPVGSVLVCVPLTAWPRPLRPGQRVLVEDWRGGKVAVVCRELRIHDGAWWLWPRSSSPDWQAPQRWRDTADTSPHPPLGTRKPDGLHVVAIVRLGTRAEPD